MDALSSLAGSVAALRPADAAQHDLARLLRHGQMIAGEVLESFGGGSVVIGLAGQRVPAESHVELQPGERFLALVQKNATQVALRLLGTPAGGEDDLVRALRLAGAGESDRLTWLAQLADLVPRQAGARPAALLRELALALREQVHVPGSGGTAIREQVRHAGVEHEALLARAATGRVDRALVARAAHEIARAVAPALAAQTGSVPADTRALALALEAALARDPAAVPEPGAPVRSWVRVLLAALPPETPGRTAGRGLAPALERALAAAHVRPWLEVLGGRAESAPAREIAAAELAERARTDLKGRLLAALREAVAPELGEAIEGALRGLEGEQLEELVRARGDDPRHVQLVVQDRESLLVAHLFLPREARRDADGEEREPAGDDARRLGLQIDFSGLGPVQAEIVLRAGDLFVRLAAEREGTIERLQAGLPRLEELLASLAASVRIAVGPAARVASGAAEARSDGREPPSMLDLMG